LLTGLVLLCNACGEDSPAPARQAPSAPASATGIEPVEPAGAAAAEQPADFVGAAECAGCHPAQAMLWGGSHHQLAMQEAGAETLLGDFEAGALSHLGVTSRFSRRGEQFLVLTPDGEAGPEELEVAYAFGVEPLQQLLVRRPGGRLQALPMAWDARPAAEGGQRWFHVYPDEPLPPGDPLHWAGPYQNWNHMCGECHATQLRKRYRADGDHYETDWEELNVACEACHGPGSRHVEWAQQPPAGAEPAAPEGFGLEVAVSGARGEWALTAGEPIAKRSAAADRSEVELCARCHARRATLREDYEYGRPLLDSHRLALLEEDLYHADGQILDEVYVYGSFLQSAMYEAGVSCSDCHDPHSLEVRGGADAVCLSCHRSEVFDSPAHHHHEAGSAGARCVECHMPERVYMQVDARRDHGFKIPRPDLAAELGVPDACTGCHADRDAAWAAGVVAGWRAGRPPAPHFASAIAAGRRRSPGAVQALARLADDRSQPGIVRATALELLAQQPVPPPPATVETAVGNPDPLVRMAAARAGEALPPELRARLLAPLLGDELLAVRVEAARVLADAATSGWASADRAALSRALDEYRQVLRLDADRPEAQLGLGLLHARRGELAGAERAYARALEIVPGATPARINLADLHRMQGRDEQAEQVLREGLAADPESADLSHALGLALVRRGRHPEAIEVLGRAAELAPEQPRYAYVYAVALAGVGEGARAVTVLEEAQRRHPGDPQLLLALSTLSRDSGDLDAARRWARELVALRPQDPQARALLDSLAGPSP